MNILITNDDGYQAEGLKRLVEYALPLGTVYVVAPKVEQSGKSQSLIFKTGYEVKQINDIVPGVKTWVVDSTPTDCVRIAVYYLKLDFDVVFSGINAGFNIGNDIAYSGTFGAANEAVLAGKKGIAFSTDFDSFKGVIDNFDKVLKEILDKKLLDKCDLYNINLPAGAKEIRYTNQGGVHYDSIYYKGEGDYVMAEPIKLWTRLDYNETDIDLVHDKFITITPMKADKTNYEILKLFKENKK